MRRTLASLASIASAALLFAVSPAEAQTLRYSSTAAGKIIGIGNTLGLAKQTGKNGPGTADSIGTFISLAPTVDNTPADGTLPWPVNTTGDWHANGSTATFTLPEGAEVLYAELLWGGSYKYGSEDVSTFLETPVTLSMGGATSMVSPDSNTALTIAKTATGGFAVNYYLRSADVTAFVKSKGGGTYSVSGVPATQDEIINTLNAAGWSMAVVVHDPAEPIRNLSVFVGGSFVDENSQQDYTVSGFCTPPSGMVNGHAIVSAIEGDASLTGDQLLIGATSGGTFHNLSGPNNPVNNFFASQINGEDGLIDTSGSFGNLNHDAALGVNVAGGRQGWDVTTVSLSSADMQLSPGQTSAVLRTITTGDSYVPTLAALAIDVNAPDFTGAGSKIATSATKVKLGDHVKLTLDLENSGQVDAQSVKLKLALDPGLTLASFTTDGVMGDANKAAVTIAGLATGVDEGTVSAGKTREVVLDLVVSSAPQGAGFLFQPSWAYHFEVCAGGSGLDETFAQSGLVEFDDNGSSSSASSGGSGGAGGSGGGAGGSTETSSGGAGGGTGGESTGTKSSGSSGSTAVVGDGGGCGCSVPGDEPSRSPAGALGLLLGAAALVRVRARARKQASRAS